MKNSSGLKDFLEEKYWKLIVLTFIHIIYFYFIEFFQAAAVSGLLYGCTTWNLTKHLEKKLDGN